jgi:hypothetical protein
VNTVHLANGEQLVVDLITSSDNPRLLGRESVLTSDLALARDETWREGMRAGALGLQDPVSFSMEVKPGTRENSHLAGFNLELGTGQQRFGRRFGAHCLASVARRRVAELIRQRAIESETPFKYYLNSVPSGDGNGAASDQPADAPTPVTGRVIKSTDSIAFETAPLADYLRRSEVMPRDTAPSEDEPEPPMPAFIEDELWEQGLQLARRGGNNESAAVWTGRVMRDTASPELFLVIDACIEAKHAEESELSVTFSGETWSRVREVLAQRRRRLQRPQERIVGAVHGHNFLPPANEAGQRMCEACAGEKYCGRTTALASVADFEWFAAVFAHQPWALSLIHGYNARGQNDWRLYHLANGGLAPRTIRRLKS